MKNEWNLKLLFDGEKQWRETVVSLPGQAAAIHERLEKLSDDTDRKESRIDADRKESWIGIDGNESWIGIDGKESWINTDTGMVRADSENDDRILSAAEALEGILRALEMMITDSAHAEIWLSCMTTLHPVDPHYAALSDLLDRSELGELPLVKEIQAYLRSVPDLEEVLASRPYLWELSDYCRHLKNRIIPLESLDGEPGGGWYRVNALMKDASVEYHGETVSWQELRETDSGSDWSEEMHSCQAELHQLFYDKYKDAAAEILIDELSRDEQDYRKEGADSLTVYLREYGFPEDAVEAVLTAVEEGLPEWFACKRKLDIWHEELEARYAEEAQDTEDRSGRRDDVESGQDTDPESDMDINADSDTDRKTEPGADSQPELPTENEAETEGLQDSQDEFTGFWGDSHEAEQEPINPAESAEQEPVDPAEVEEQNAAAYAALRNSLLEQFGDFHPAFREMLEESFAGKWVWINDDPLAFMDQHASMVPGTSHSYIALSADCYLPAAAHELGHAWANYCVKDQNILYNQNEILLEFPSNLAALWSYRWTIDHRYETIDRVAASGAGQDVVDYLTWRAESPLIYEEMLGETLANIYDGYTSFLFERELRSRILTEKLTAEEISAMYLKYRRRILPPEEQGKYLDPFLWVERHNLFTCRSYYNLPYILSMLLAYRVMGEIRRTEPGKTQQMEPGDRQQMTSGETSGGEPEESTADLWDRVTELLRSMNRRPAEDVLQEFFGEDIRSVEFWRSCMAEVTVLFRKMEEAV